MDPRHPPLDDRERADAVLTGERCDVGLVDGHGGDAEPARGSQPDRPEHDRRGEVDDVGAEARDRSLHRGVRQPEGERAVSGQRHRAHPHHASISVAGRPGTRGDDQHIVAGIHEPVRDVPDCVGDAVDVGEEGLGHDGDSHDTTVGGE